MFLIDDHAGAGEGQRRAKQQSRAVVWLLGALGFYIGWKDKCQLHPRQWARFLGLLVDARLQTFAVPKDKALAFRGLAEELLAASSITDRQIAAVVGKMIAMSPAISLAPLHARAVCGAMQGLGSWDAVYATPKQFKQG